MRDAEETAVSIRPAQKSDLDSIVAIAVSQTVLPPWTRAHFEEEIDSPRSYFCVATEPSGEAGPQNPEEPAFPRRMARSEMPPPKSVGARPTDLPGDLITGFAGIKMIPPEAQVTNIAVSARWMRRGLGRRLMEHLQSLAAGRGCSVITLEVSSANSPALGLYRGLGYSVVGRRLKYYNDGTDALLMTKGL